MNIQEYHSYVGGMIFDLEDFPVDDTHPSGRWFRITNGGEGPLPLLFWHQMFNGHEYYIGLFFFLDNPPPVESVGFTEDEIEVLEIPNEVAIDSLRALGFFQTEVTSILPIALVLGLVGIVMLGKFK